MEKIKVLLVDDHQIILDGIRSVIQLSDEIDVIGEALNGKEAIDCLQLIDVDVVIMDVDMPVMNGMEAVKQIRDQRIDTRIIVLSMHDEGGLIKQLINAGVDGYMLKNCDQNELVNAIKLVASGKKYFSSEVTISLMDRSPQNKSMDIAVLSSLTERELEIMKLIAEGFSNKEIGEKLFISHRTVDTHRTNLMKKIDVKNIAGIIRFAIKNGIVS